MTPVLLVAGVLLAALVAYALGGGRGLRRRRLGSARARTDGRPTAGLIAQAIGPIWEANHVWLVLVVVLMFVAFPAVYAAISVALHLPLVLLLAGIVLRGSAFTFRAYGEGSAASREGWGRVFAVSSVVTPLMLGVCVGAVFGGRVRVDGATLVPAGGYVSSWLAPFPIAVGLFALALCAYLAACYLAVEAREEDLRDAFRQRAIGAGILTGVLAWGCLLLAGAVAPFAQAGLMRREGALVFQLLVAAIALGALWALWIRQFALARAFAATQVAMLVAGWGWAQFPYALPPDLTLVSAAAPEAVLRPMLVALAAGALVLFPSLGLLFSVFKRRAAGAGGH